MQNRRSFVKNIILLSAAPAFIPLERIMPVKPIIIYSILPENEWMDLIRRDMATAMAKAIDNAIMNGMLSNG